MDLPSSFTAKPGVAKPMEDHCPSPWSLCRWDCSEGTDFESGPGRRQGCALGDGFSWLPPILSSRTLTWMWTRTGHWTWTWTSSGCERAAAPSWHPWSPCPPAAGSNEQMVFPAERGGQLGLAHGLHQNEVLKDRWGWVQKDCCMSLSLPPPLSTQHVKLASLRKMHLAHTSAELSFLFEYDL